MSARGRPALRSASDLLRARVEAHRTPDQPPRPGEHEQVAHDFRGAIGFAVDRRLDLAPQPLRKRAGARSSSRCPRTPCSGLFSSCAMPATNCPSAASFSDCVRRLRSSSRSASSRVCGVRSRATSTVADPLPVLVEQIRHRDDERPIQDRIDDLARRRRVGRGSAGDPRARLRIAPSASRPSRDRCSRQRPVEQLVARQASAGWRTPRWRARSARADRRRRPGG